MSEATDTKTPRTIVFEGQRFHLYLAAADIQARVTELARAISLTHAQKRPLLIGVLSGSFVFLADLVRAIDIPCEIDFCKFTSYGDARESSGRIQTEMLPRSDLTGRHVILVEDIVDTGRTLEFLLQIVESRAPASIRVVTLLLKEEAVCAKVTIDHVGFSIPNRFVIGYGLDLGQQFRNLQEIYMLED